MTVEKLMLPRFEIIADYPGLAYNVGIILTPITHNFTYYDCEQDPSNKPIGFPEKYPHLFKKLNWWEHRKVEDMPKKLICKAIKDDTEITEIEEWDMEILVGWIDKKSRSCCSLTTFNPEYGYFPID